MNKGRDSISRYLFRIEDLKSHLTSEDVVVYGAGNYGKRLVDYINSIKAQERIQAIVVTDGEYEIEYRNIPILDALSYLENCEAVTIIIAVSVLFQEDIASLVRKFGKNYVYMTDELYVAMGAELDKKLAEPYHGLDFMLTGFIKCGTTSLYHALYGCEDIYLSKQKETQFFTWCHHVKNPARILQEEYFGNIREEQIIGMIDPDFTWEAERVHAFFGPDIKILFIVRNPVKATFSLFKSMCRIGGGNFADAYKSFGGFDIRMLDEYIERDLERCRRGYQAYIFEYIYWIRQYWKVYPKNQVKIIFFEELVRETQAEMDSILNFIGSRSTYKGDSFPLENKGYVMANQEGYKAAELLHKLNNQMRAFRVTENPDRQLQELREQIMKAKKIYDIEMTDGQKERLENFFAQSVRELEDALGKDLSKIWF